MDTILTAHVLAFQDDKVLLVRHGEEAGHINGTYGIPGGRLDGSESMKQAAARELREETGLEVQEKELQTFPRNEYTADIKRKDGTTKRYTMTVYLTQVWSGDLKESGETTPEWVNLEELKNKNLLPNVKEAISAASAFLEEGYVNEG